MGENNDIVLLKVNRFLNNFYNIKTALIMNNFPCLIANVAYLPLFLVISILNLIRMEILNMITYFVLLLLSLVFVGAVFGLLIMVLKGT